MNSVPQSKFRLLWSMDRYMARLVNPKVSGNDLVTYCVGEVKARMGETHVFQKGVQLSAREATPRTRQILPQFGLLEGIVSIEEVEKDLLRRKLV